MLGKDRKKEEGGVGKERKEECCLGKKSSACGHDLLPISVPVFVPVFVALETCAVLIRLMCGFLIVA